MSKTLLPSNVSTGMRRTTVHAQYNGTAFGFVMFNNLIPIVLTIRKPGGEFSNVILVFGKRAHKYVPYSGYGIRKKCCIKTLLFNVHHYIQCYLNGGETGPYTFNCCNKCDVKLEDGCGHLIEVSQRREYNVNKFIYKTDKVLQNPGNNDAFQYQKGNC